MRENTSKKVVAYNYKCQLELQPVLNFAGVFAVCSTARCLADYLEGLVFQNIALSCFGNLDF